MENIPGRKARQLAASLGCVAGRHFFRAVRRMAVVTPANPPVAALTLIFIGMLCFAQLRHHRVIGVAGGGPQATIYQLAVIRR